MGVLAEIEKNDPEVYGYIKEELLRQQEGLEMIPSENFTSMAVMQASGSILTNKYSEGYPGRRYYGGNEYIDKVESLAIERAKSLFGVPHANVQAYSGSPANLAVYLATCENNDPIMGLYLYDGGHLTHGWKLSITSRFFKSVPYHVKPDGYIDIDEARKLANENKPKLIWIGATAYPRQLPFKEFAAIADEVGAYLAADIAHVAGLVLAGAHESPVKYAHIVTTTTHKTLRGPRGGLIMVTQKGLDKDPDLAQKIDKAIIPGFQGGPHNHQTAAIAVALKEAAKPEFREYGHQIVRNAKALAEGLMANGVKLVSNGTDNHLLLADLTTFGPGAGVFGQDVLEAAGVTANKNTIPGEPSSPFYPSGVRMGTPALTTRGMKEPEMKAIGGIIAEAFNEIKPYSLPKDKDERTEYLKRFREEIRQNKKLAELRTKVRQMCKQFPLYPEMVL